MTKQGTPPDDLCYQIFDIVCQHPDGIEIVQIAAKLNRTYNSIYARGVSLGNSGMLIWEDTQGGNKLWGLCADKSEGLYQKWREGQVTL